MTTVTNKPEVPETVDVATPKAPITVGATAVDAIGLVQAGRRLFVTALTGEQLITQTQVDPYNSELAAGDPNQGYQRPPERSRITRIGSYLIKEAGDGLYPNAVLLGSREPLRYDPVSRRLELPRGGKFRVIDGQHRIAGLRYAIEEKEAKELAFMSIPVVIVEISEKVTEMDQFRIINSTAKSVRTDLVNAILTAIAEAEGADAIAEKDHWKVVITKVVDALDRRDDSPWKDILLMPDEIGASAGAGKITRATSAITSIRVVYEWLRGLDFLSGKPLDEQAEFLTDILVAYWGAIRNVVPQAFEVPGDYVIQKTPGLFSLHYLLKESLLPTMWQGRREWDEATFQEFIQDSPEITDPDFWAKGANRAAAYGSMKGFRDLAELLKDSVKVHP